MGFNVGKYTSPQKTKMLNPQNCFFGLMILFFSKKVFSGSLLVFFRGV